MHTKTHTLTLSYLVCLFICLLFAIWLCASFLLAFLPQTALPLPFSPSLAISLCRALPFSCVSAMNIFIFAAASLPYDFILAIVQEEAKLWLCLLPLRGRMCRALLFNRLLWLARLPLEWLTRRLHSSPFFLLLGHILRLAPLSPAPAMFALSALRLLLLLFLLLLALCSLCLPPFFSLSLSSSYTHLPSLSPLSPLFGNAFRLLNIFCPNNFGAAARVFPTRHQASTSISTSASTFAFPLPFAIFHFCSAIFLPPL